MADDQPPKKALSPDDYPELVALGLGQLVARNLDPNDYEVLLLDSPGAWTVVFRAKDLPAGFRGSPPGVPGIEVSIEKNTKAIESATFIR